MKRLHALFLLLILTLAPLHLTASERSSYISMNFPEAVIADALRRIMPLSFEGISDRMEGSITIAKISNLRLLDKKIFCHLNLTGSNLNLITRVANQNIRLKLGSAAVDFDCDAQIRYDAQQKTLFIRPMARGVQGADAIREGDIGKTLLLFLNGREFALTMQDLKPIIAEASNKIITIQTRIMGMRIVPGALQLHLAPQIAVHPKQ